MGSKSKSIVKDIAIVAAGVLIIWLGLQAVFGTQNPFYVVSSGSMVPSLLVYDVIVVQGNDPFEEVEVGDIIVFDRPAGHDRVIVHRVVSIVDDDPYTVRTQGDANPSSIPGTDFPITSEEYIGTVAYVIPQVGFITRIFATQVGGIPLNYIIIAIIVGIMIAKQFVKRKEEPRIGTGDSPDTDDDKGPANLGGLDVPKDSEYLEPDSADRAAAATDVTNEDGRDGQGSVVEGSESTEGEKEEGEEGYQCFFLDEFKKGEKEEGEEGEKAQEEEKEEERNGK